MSETESIDREKPGRADKEPKTSGSRNLEHDDGEAAPDTELTAPSRFLNRELELLNFQNRVLAEAMDQANPLLERVKFLAIVGANLDEFFMVRIGGLIMQKRAGLADTSLDGRTAAEQLVEIRRAAVDLMDRMRRHWQDELRPALAAAGIHVLDYDELSDKQLQQVNTTFRQSLFPVLTPQGFDPGHPFPHVSNLSLNLAVTVRDRAGEEHFARVKIPSTLPRLVPIKRSSGGERRNGTVPHNHYFVWLEQVVARNLGALFPGLEILQSHPFRVTRNADIELQELEADDLLERMSENVNVRRFSPVICLAHEKGMPAKIRKFLSAHLKVDRNDIYELPAPLAISGLGQLCGIDRFDLRDQPFNPAPPAALHGDGYDGDLFAAIRSGDILLHHPYESFDVVVDLLRRASRDPDVLAIKQTLYRVGENSQIVKYLLEARREYRKQVTVLVELKARFDESSNIGWARMLEQAGVHVIYGMVGLKTHAKALMIVRREGEAVRRYLHLGTGNYNHGTARVYEDLGMLTCNEAIADDINNMFNYLTGYAEISDFNALMIAPLNLRRRLEELVRREIEHALAGRGGRIIIKANSLVDRRFIDLLYEASTAGVSIDLLIRGMCCLRPGLPGLSENIRVRSIVGRFLEHSRIYYFHNDGAESLYLGSADPMTRNLDRRVEVVFPVTAPALVRRLVDDVLLVALRDNVKARHMAGDGSYAVPPLAAGEEPFDSQGQLLARRGKA